MMGKTRKKNKVQKLTDLEYAAYIASLRAGDGMPPQTYPLIPTVIPPLPIGEDVEHNKELE